MDPMQIGVLGAFWLLSEGPTSRNRDKRGHPREPRVVIAKPAIFEGEWLRVVDVTFVI